MDASQFKQAAKLGRDQDQHRHGWPPGLDTAFIANISLNILKNFDLRPARQKSSWQNTPKFIAQKNEYLGSAGQLETVRKLVS